MKGTRTGRKPGMFAILLGAASVAAAEPATMSGGWSAEISPAIQQSGQKSAIVFQLEGSYKLVTAGLGERYFLLRCVGMDSVTRLSAAESTASGNGRCELKDQAGERLFAAMETAIDGFTLKIDGGTGKWATTRGTLVSKESFTVESERQLKAYSNMKGEIVFAN